MGCAQAKPPESVSIDRIGILSKLSPPRHPETSHVSLAGEDDVTARSVLVRTDFIAVPFAAVCSMSSVTFSSAQERSGILLESLKGCFQPAI